MPATDAAQPPARLAGLLCPALTPYRSDLKPDGERLLKHCRWLAGEGAGLAVFGTTSEGNSLALDEKLDLLDQLAAGGIDTARMMPGTGLCSAGETSRLSRHAVTLGCGGVLMLPPFYYKEVSDEGLYSHVAGVIDAVGSADLRIYLYHIPPVAMIGWSADLIERLVTAYPDTVVGIKDSSGDWRNTHSLLERGWDDFRVFVGSEAFLLRGLQHGGAGCISATANINPGPITRLIGSWREAGADEQQSALDRVRNAVARYPMIPALKAIIAAWRDDPGWGRVRPPLTSLDDETERDLIAAVEQAGLNRS